MSLQQDLHVGEVAASADADRLVTAPPAADRARARWARHGRGTAVHVASVSAFLLLWWLITKLELVRPLYLPSPGAVWDAFIRANTDHPISEGSDRIVRGEQNYYLWEHL